MHGCPEHAVFLEPKPSHHFYGAAFPLTAIFVISLETIKCLITLVFFFFFLSQNSLLITNHNFKDRRAVESRSTSLCLLHVYIDFSLAR